MRKANAKQVGFAIPIPDQASFSSSLSASGGISFPPAAKICSNAYLKSWQTQGQTFSTIFGKWW
jgi:hypothetical protein